MLKKTISLFVFLAILTATINFIPQESEAAWWDSNYLHYKQLSISNSVNDYQMRIVVNYSTGDINCSGNIQTDFDDIRFVDIDNSTELDYYRDWYVTSDHAVFWVELPSDIETDQKILMYYGRDGIGSGSNGTNTFPIFFDDASTNRSDEYTLVDIRNDDINAVWYHNGTEGAYHVNCSVGASGDGVLIRIDNVSDSDNIRLHARLKRIVDTANDQMGLIGRQINQTDFVENKGMHHSTLKNIYMIEYVKAVENILTTTGHVIDTNYYTAIFGIYNDQANCTWWNSTYTQVCDDGATIDDTNLSSGRWGVYAGWDNDPAEMRFKDVFAMNLTDPEPTVSALSPEQSQPLAMGIIDSYLDGGYITWSGIDNQALYCNETAGVGNNLTIYTTMNASYNCTDIHIDLSGDTAMGTGDEVDFDSSSGNSDMYLQVGTDDTWSDEWVQFTDANSYNISLNDNWDSLSDDPNPFNITSGDGNTTIICIFKLDLEDGLTPGTHQTSSTTIWKVKHEYASTG